jgi:hypothetical protein
MVPRRDEYHLNERGKARCTSGLPPDWFNCVEAANNIMTKYYPEETAKGTLKWFDTTKYDEVKCGLGYWGTVPSMCSLQTQLNGGKGPFVAHYIERMARSWCPEHDIDPDFQMICSGLKPPETPALKSFDETEEMYKNHCEPWLWNLESYSQFYRWCEIVPLQKSREVPKEISLWTHESECLKHRKCIAGFGNWRTDSHVDCVDTVSPCQWNEREGELGRCTTGVNYAQRVAQDQNPVLKIFHYREYYNLLMQRLHKEKQKWRARDDPKGPYPEDFTQDYLIGIRDNRDGRSGNINIDKIKKDYFTHFGHCSAQQQTWTGRRLLEEKYDVYEDIDIRENEEQVEEFIEGWQREEAEEADEKYDKHEEEDEEDELQQSLQHSMANRKLLDIFGIEKAFNKIGNDVKAAIDSTVEKALSPINDAVDWVEDTANSAVDIANRGVAMAKKGVDAIKDVANKAAKLAKDVAAMPQRLWDQIYGVIPTVSN